MFLGKINSDNNTILLNVLNSITCNGIDGLTNIYFRTPMKVVVFFSKNSESPFIELDFLIYRIYFVEVMFDI